MPWRRKWQPTPVFFPGKLHGQKSLVGNSAWSHKELDTTECTYTHTHTHTHTHTQSIELTLTQSRIGDVTGKIQKYAEENQ